MHKLLMNLQACGSMGTTKGKLNLMGVVSQCACANNLPSMNFKIVEEQLVISHVNY